MLIQGLIRSDDWEFVDINVLNTDASSLTTGMGVCLLGGQAAETASADGYSATASTAARWPGFVGIAQKDIPSNSNGLVRCWGKVDSVLLSNEGTSVTVGITGYTFLQPSAVAGQFTSGLAAEAVSTQLYKYAYNLATTAVSAQAWTPAVVRAF